MAAKKEEKEEKKILGKPHFKKLDWVERARDQVVEVDYPQPVSRYRLVFESYQLSIEETYFWILDHLRDSLGFPIVDKIMDLFTASEMSSFWGVQQQRLQMQQEQIGKHLGNIGGFVKQLFQMVRELRIIDERLSLYQDADSKSSPSRNSAESTLKGLYVDVVEGGAKNPSSVLGLGTQLQFTALPDLFFTTHPVKIEDVDSIVDKMDFNERVRSLLKRKLRSYLTWKIHTEKELKNRRSFMLKYLRHHYNIILMYIGWIKPYLKNVKRITGSQKWTETPDIIGAFEGSVVEAEFLARALPQGNKKYYGVILVHMDYRTRPTLSYQAEGYQRGPIHVGRVSVTMRSYSWSQEDIDNYKKMSEDENFDIMEVADGSLKAAMDALGDDLKRYLEEEGEKISKDEVKKEVPRLTSPFSALIGGFGDLGGAFLPKPKSKDELPKLKSESEEGKAKALAKKVMWTCYKNYKKAHRMMAW